MSKDLIDDWCRRPPRITFQSRRVTGWAGDNLEFARVMPNMTETQRLLGMDSQASSFPGRPRLARLAFLHQFNETHGSGVSSPEANLDDSCVTS